MNRIAEKGFRPKDRYFVPLTSAPDLATAATKNFVETMQGILADVFALYLKTKNIHWHMSGPYFRDYQVIMDEQADQLYAMTDAIAEHIRKISGSKLRSISHIAHPPSFLDNNTQYIEPSEILGELYRNNESIALRLRGAREVCNTHHDVASANTIQAWIHETERRTWFFFEASAPDNAIGH